MQNYLLGCTVWCAKFEYPNSEVHGCNCRAEPKVAGWKERQSAKAWITAGYLTLCALVFTTTETTGTTVWKWTLCCLLTTTKTTFTSLKAGCHLTQLLLLSRLKRKSVDNSRIFNAFALSARPSPTWNNPGCRYALPWAMFFCAYSACWTLYFLQACSQSKSVTVPFWVQQTGHPNYLP